MECCNCDARIENVPYDDAYSWTCECDNPDYQALPVTDDDYEQQRY